MLAVFAVTGLSTRSQGMDIVRNGRASAVIVVQQAAESPPGRTQKARAAGFDCSDTAAASVLADWIEKISGAKLQVTDQPHEGRPAIYVGASAVAAGLDLSGIDSPTKEGLRIVSDADTRILIGGQNDTSTMKAVCRFLEELGCRYYMDNELGEVFPQNRNVSVGNLDITDKPGLMMRKIWGSQWTGQSLWKIWNGAGGLQMSTGHAWAAYVDQSLWQVHPEYFALRDGERRKGDWYCTSNPELRRIFAEGVIAKGDPNPSVSPPDGNGYCQCDKCRAQDDPSSIEPSSGMVSVTNRYADFLDAVAKQVAELHPDWLLSFYCYADYTQPPTFNRRLSPNLVAWIAPIRYSRYHRIGSPVSPSRIQLAEVIDGWSAAVQHIAYRTYNYNLAECLVPFSKLSVWEHDIPYLKSKGYIGINLESLANWEIYGPHIYQSIRLAYDPAADGSAIMDDYFSKFYGSAAGPFMKQYWTGIDGAFANMKCESGSFYALHLVYTPQLLLKLADMVEKASRAAQDDGLYAARVAMTTEGFRNAVQYVQMRDAMNKGDFAAAKEVYDDLYARNETELQKGYSNQYTLSYLKRFVGTHILAGATATALPGKLVQVLPDRMKLAYDPEDEGFDEGYHTADFDDSTWREVLTYSQTLNAQGLPDTKAIMWYRTAIDIPPQDGRLSLFFTEVDGQAVTVYVNGSEVGALGARARRKPFEVDITDAARPGRNVVAVKIDHRKITELYLGGIVRPILLIGKPKGRI